MKCPKCQYISFDSGGRCRNCGYDFSLSADVEVPDLPIQTGSEPIGPLSELSLRDASASVDQFPSETEMSVSDAPSRPITSSFDLPLFRDRAGARPVATQTPPAAPPRAPLAVRRQAPVAPKPGPKRAEPELDDREPRLALDTAEIPVARAAHLGATTTVGVVAAPALARIGGGLIDFAIIAGINALVLYFTLRICELSFAEVRSLPLAPLVAFLLLLDGGYFATFVTAGGQTIGKMAMGTRVIPGDPNAGASERVPLGHAIVRAAAYFVSALPAGLGFLPGLIGQDRRALHDRLADTRVIKV
jgi:uncharacterized RDD family membrane protein YckC